VSVTKHQQVVAERDRAQERAAMLEASAGSLEKERVALVNELEDLRVAREAAERSVAELSQARADLEQSLSAREAELAARKQEVDQLRGTYDGLVADLQQEVATGRIEIERMREGLRVKLAQEVLFPSGSAVLSGEGRDVIAKVAKRLNETPHRVEVQGHTDDVAISGKLAQQYPTNWELAGARAAGVVRVLQQNGVPAARLVAASYGEARPVESNATPEGRARNRRIEIRLIPSAPGSE
jgi:chemotaxis protein MotB